MVSQFASYASRSDAEHVAMWKKAKELWPCLTQKQRDALLAVIETAQIDPEQGLLQGNLWDFITTISPGIASLIPGSFVGSLMDVPKFLGLLTQAQTWVRVGMVVGGAVLVIGGVGVFARELGAPIPGVGKIPLAGRIAA